MSCAPSTGLYLADLETPNAKALAARTKANCARVLKERRLPELGRDLTEVEVAALIARRGGQAINCAESALAYVEHVTKTHRALARRKRIGRQ